jgi:hypothetical protein
VQSTTSEVRGQFEGLDHLGVEKQLLKTPGVLGARANPAPESVTVDFDEATVAPAALRKVIQDWQAALRDRASTQYYYGMPREAFFVHRFEREANAMHRTNRLGDDIEYFRARALEEQVAGAKAQSSEARKCHDELAMMYRFKVAMPPTAPDLWADSLVDEWEPETA